MRIDWKLEKTAPAFAEIKAAESTVRSKTAIETLFIFASLHLFSILLMMACRNLGWGIARTLSGGNLSAHTAEMILLLFTAIPICGYLAYCRYVEHRSAKTMGFLRRGAVWKYAAGALTGMLMMGAAVGIPIMCGAMEFEGSKPENIGLVLMILPCWMIQGMCEELEFRGYLMLTLGLHKPPVFAVTVSAVIFSLSHLANPGISLLPVINLTLAGIMFGVMFLRSGNIWCGAALHGFWNFAQGNLFGIKVSGGESGASLLYVSAKAGSSDWLTGGAFGIEGSISTAMVFIIVILTVYVLPQSGAKKENLQ